MIELVFVACLLSAPERCEEKALLFSDVTPMACLMGAQPQLAQWTESHPKWSVARWSCRPVDTRAAKI